MPGRQTSDKVISKLKDIKHVSPYNLVPNEFFGQETKNQQRLPGPFAELKPLQVLNIDPRRKKF